MGQRQNHTEIIHFIALIRHDFDFASLHFHVSSMTNHMHNFASPYSLKHF